MPKKRLKIILWLVFALAAVYVALGITQSFISWAVHNAATLNDLSPKIAYIQVAVVALIGVLLCASIYLAVSALKNRRKTNQSTDKEES